MESFINLERAMQIINENVEKLPKKRLDILQCLGKICAENICASIDNPPFDKSAMDGFAIMKNVRKGDELAVLYSNFAGENNNYKLENSQAIKITTGAVLPIDTYAVIKKEDVIEIDNKIIIQKDVSENENICFKAEDIKQGDIIVCKNKKLNYADIGILASSGIAHANVYDSPKIAFISTGFEIIDIDKTLENGKIYNSNKYSIISRILELGFDITYINHAQDDTKDIACCILEAEKVADVIITSGGVSVSEKDLLPDAVDFAGGTKLFWKVLIKPGSAMLFSKINKSIVISLSGNPTAALTTFELIAKPCLQKLMGVDSASIKKIPAKMGQDYNKCFDKPRFIRGKVIFDNAAISVMITQTKSGNGILSSTISSDCIIEIKASDKPVKKGNIVNIIMV